MENVFDLLDREVCATLRRWGFHSPTVPQEIAIPRILEGKNTLIISPTGSGKTEAAILPIFHFLMTKNDEKGIKAIYVTPLKALNRDMLSRLERWVPLG